MKVLTRDQIREADSFTIKNEPIDSLDLMERASRALCEQMLKDYRGFNSFHIYAGTGNNGGDGVAIARMLNEKGKKVVTYIIGDPENGSEDFKLNLEKLSRTSAKTVICGNKSELENCSDDEIIVDAIFGSGLSRPVEGWFAQVIKHINHQDAQVVSVDIPSGLFCEDNTHNNGAIVHSNITYTFEFPKLSFLFPDNYRSVPNWKLIPINLSQEFKTKVKTPFQYTALGDVKTLVVPRNKFAHKGTFGHSLMMAGSKGKMGAAVMSVKASIRAGVGLSTAYIPEVGNDIMQIAVPEAMTIECVGDKLNGLPDLTKFSAIGIGPGIGTSKETASLLKVLIQEAMQPMVIDADALNILADNKTWLSFFKYTPVLTPHPGEFTRLVGKGDGEYGRLQKQIEFSRKYNCIVVLKGAYTSITSPNGNTYFNSTGNPGMATGGSGDILTGIITGLLAQGYTPLIAAVLGTYVHGMAGDIAAEKNGEISMTAGDVLENLGSAFYNLQ